MIPVKLAPEPPSFDCIVRQKGLSALAQMVGEMSRMPRRGRPRQPIATRKRDIPSDQFPAYWRNALGDLLVAYERRCAFLALYIERATGTPSVDHMIPKSKRWNQVYEWKNYRLCSGSVNAKKKDLTGIVDPFVCKRRWFALELVGFQVTRGQNIPAVCSTAVDETIRLLNSPEFCKAREEYVSNYENFHIDFAHLKRRAPFIAQELRRQGRLLQGDR